MNPEEPQLPSGSAPEEAVPGPPASAPLTPSSAEAVDEGPGDPLGPDEAPAPGAPQVAAQALPGPPGMPAMPGEAADETDDFEDDFEIPEDVSYDHIRRHEPSPTGPRHSGETAEMLQGLVVGKRRDGLFVDIGQKSEAFLPVDPGAEVEKPLEVGDTVEVMVTGQSTDGYPVLSSLKTQRPSGWIQLEAAFQAGEPVLGRVLGTIKGGLSVDVGVRARAFMPASRSGERTEEGLQGLVGQQVKAKILQLDQHDRNVVLDRRSVLDQERAAYRREALNKFEVGDRVPGIVRTLRKFGAFVDLGGIDGLLHVSDIAWHRVNDPSDVLQIGQELTVQILKVDRRAERIAVGLKHLQPEPWSLVADQVKANDRIQGKVMRIKEYGAFVEVIPGVEGLVHISDMSYSRRVRHPSEIVKVGDVVEVMVLDVKARQRRIALGLKQALGDPWQRVGTEHPVGSKLIGTVRKITNFGAFVEVIEGVDALLHISDISNRRLNSPAEVLREGQRVRVVVLDLDPRRRRLKVGMKQLEPTELDKFLDSAEVGETVTGMVVKMQGSEAVVDIGDGVRGVCRSEPQPRSRKDVALGQTSNLSSLKSMLESAWNDEADGSQSGPQQPLKKGAVHTFRIKKLDAESGSIELDRI